MPFFYDRFLDEGSLLLMIFLFAHFFLLLIVHNAQVH